METEFTPLLSLLGGVLIGIAATLLMAVHGRIAGMTGILAGLIPPLSSDWQWRAAFMGGAVIAPLVYISAGGDIQFALPVSTPALIFGGVLVGIGVYLGSGCTSGHGVCGMARLSPRSLAATVTFMIAAFATVYVIRHVMEGA